jgi:hypothetical protein
LLMRPHDIKVHREITVGAFGDAGLGVGRVWAFLHFLRKPKSDPAKFGAPLEKKRPFCQAEVMNNNFVLNRRAFHENSIFTPNLAGLDR